MHLNYWILTEGVFLCLQMIYEAVFTPTCILYLRRGTIGLPELALGMNRADMKMDDEEIMEIVKIMVCGQKI